MMSERENNNEQHALLRAQMADFFEEARKTGMDNEKFREFFRKFAKEFYKSIHGKLPQQANQSIDGRAIQSPPFVPFFKFLKDFPEMFAEFRMAYLLNMGDNIGPRPFLDQTELESLNKRKLEKMQKLFEDLDWMQFIDNLKPEEKENTFLMYHDYISAELLTLSIRESEKVANETTKTGDAVRNVIE